MKKRVLSVLLALTLCFTMFAGMALAANDPKAPLGNAVERNINRVDNALSVTAAAGANAADYANGDTQQKRFDEAVNAISDGDIDVDALVDELVWKPGTDVEDNDPRHLITETMLHKFEGIDNFKENQTLSYFVILQLSDRYHGRTNADGELVGEPIDEAAYPQVVELVKKFDALNAKDSEFYTGDRSEGIASQFDLFDGYADALTDIYTEFMDDEDAQIELFGVTGVLETVMSKDEYEQLPENFEDLVIEKAKEIFYAAIEAGTPIEREEAVRQAAEEIAEKNGVTITVINIDKDTAINEILNMGQQYAYEQIKDLMAGALKTALKSSTKDYDFDAANGNFLDAYINLMTKEEGDRNKKIAAVVVGKELIKEATSGVMPLIRKYARARKETIRDYVMNNRTALLSPDKSVAVENLQKVIFGGTGDDAMPGIIPMMIDDANDDSVKLDELPGSTLSAQEAADTMAKMKELVANLEARGLDPQNVADTVLYIIQYLDPDLDMENISYNLALNQVIESPLNRHKKGEEYDPLVEAADGTYTVQYTLSFGHRLVNRDFDLFDGDKYFHERNFSFTFADNNSTVSADADGKLEIADVAIAYGLFITYTPAETEKTVLLNVYRGDAKVEGWEVDRYVTQVEVVLPAKEEEPPVPVAEPLTVEEFAGDAITVENGTPWADVETQLVKTVTLKTAEGVPEEAKREVTADVTWTKPEGYEYLADRTEGFVFNNLVGEYKIPNEVPAPAGDVDGKVEITLTIKPKTETVTGSITIDNKDELERGTGYKAGDTVKVESTVKDIELVVIAIAKEGEPINGQNGLLYQTLTADQAHSFEFKLPADIQPGRYIVVVGNDQAKASDTSYFDVVASELNYEVFPLDGGKAYAYNVKRGTAWEDISDVIAGRFDQVGFKITKDGSLVGPQLDITWDLTKFNANKSGDQTVNGTYDLNELYAAGYTAENIGKDIDGKVSVTICRHDEDYHNRSHGGGGSSTSYNTTYFTDGTEYDGNKTIHLVGETTNTRVVIDLVGPDGKVLKSVTLARTDFLQGYDWDIADIAPLAPGTYLLQLKSTSGSLYDERKFTVNDLGQVITSDIFNKDDHFNYILGFDDGTVRPEAYITRDEVAAIMFRLLKDDVRNKNLTETTDKFTDIPEGHWSMTAFATLNTLGIYEGRGNGIMGCGDDITRAEFAALCSRFAVESATGLTSVYTDIAGNWAEKEIMAVTAAGWFQGDDNLFRPDDKITRAEVVTVMNRILGRDSLNASAFGNEDVNKYSDLSADKWYYIPMVEATTAHDYEYVDGMEVWKSTDASIDWTVYE